MSTFTTIPKISTQDISQHSFLIVETGNISTKNNQTKPEKNQIPVSLNHELNHNSERTKKLHQLIITKASKTSKTFIDKTEENLATILPEAQPVIRDLVKDVTDYLKTNYPNNNIRAIIVAGKKPPAKCTGSIAEINFNQWAQHQLRQAVDIFLAIGDELIPRTKKYSFLYASIGEVVKHHPEKYSTLRWGKSGYSMAHIEYMPAKN